MLCFTKFKSRHSLQTSFYAGDPNHSSYNATSDEDKLSKVLKLDWTPDGRNVTFLQTNMEGKGLRDTLLCKVPAQPQPKDP